jgi:hypothetical protein
MVSVIRLAAFAGVLGASGCMVHVQAGAGTSSGSMGGGTYSPPPTQTTPAPAPNHNPILANPQTPPAATTGHVTILHPLPTGNVTRDQVPVVPIRNAFGGPAGSLRGIVYYIPNDTMTMPDVSFMKPQAVVYTNSLNVNVRDYTEPVAGSGRYEFYAVQYTGTWHASKAGPYQFMLNSSDGSRVYIDDQLVVNDDGRHLPQRAAGTINLSAGDHTIRVDYFKAFRWVVALQLWVTPPGGQGQLFQSQL